MNNPDTQNLNNACKNCLYSLAIGSLIVTLGLTLAKGLVAILGSSQSLAVDGLFSLLLSFVIARSLFKLGRKQADEETDKDLWLASLVIGIILVLGIVNTLIYSFVRIHKISNAMLLEPSPYALCTAIVSILTNHLFYRYGMCIVQELGGKDITEVTGLYRVATIVSCIVLIGVLSARTFWLYGDAIAAIATDIILAVYTVRLLYSRLKITTQPTLFRESRRILRDETR
jgi:divalent metal cation (Fe/Co/Zn/Cd) transporter